MRSQPSPPKSKVALNDLTLSVNIADAATAPFENVSWRCLTCFYVESEGVVGNVKLQLAVLYLFCYLLIVSAEGLGWATSIRYYNLVPFTFLTYCILDGTEVFHVLFGRSSAPQVFLQLLPFVVLMVLTREAHQTVALMYFSGTMVIFLQLGNPKNLRKLLAVYTLLSASAYVGAVAFIQWFYVDIKGTDPYRGLALSQSISWGEESVTILSIILLGCAYVALAYFVWLFTAHVRRYADTVETLQNELDDLTTVAADVSLDTPMARALHLLDNVCNEPHNPQLRVRKAIRLLQGGGVYQPTLEGLEKDSQLSQYVNNMVDGGRAKRGAPMGPRRSVAQLPRASIPSLDATTIFSIATPRDKASVESIANDLIAFMGDLHGTLPAVWERTLREVDTREFDVLELRRNACGHVLLFTGLAVFLKHNIFEAFDVKVRTAIRFLNAIESGYVNTLPYHNPAHAASVVHTLHYYLVGCDTQHFFNDLDIFSALTAAAVHDYRHLGVTNNFLVKTKHELALRYNDRSVLENYHVSSAYAILNDTQFNILENLDATGVERHRRLLVEMVLSTDMSRHFELIGKFQAKTTKGSTGLDMNNDDDKSLLLGLLVKAADISNPMRPPTQAVSWAKRVLAEFFLQGDKEKALNMNVSMFMDREKRKQEFIKSQLGFVDIFCSPLYQALANYLPGFKPLISVIAEHRAMWERHVGDPDYNEDDVPLLRPAPQHKLTVNSTPAVSVLDFFEPEVGTTTGTSTSRVPPVPKGRLVVNTPPGRRATDQSDSGTPTTLSPQLSFPSVVIPGGQKRRSGKVGPSSVASESNAGDEHAFSESRSIDNLLPMPSSKR